MQGSHRPAASVFCSGLGMAVPDLRVAVRASCCFSRTSTAQSRAVCRRGELGSGPLTAAAAKAPHSHRWTVLWMVSASTAGTLPASWSGSSWKRGHLMATAAADCPAGRSLVGCGIPLVQIWPKTGEIQIRVGFPAANHPVAAAPMAGLRVAVRDSIPLRPHFSIVWQWGQQSKWKLSHEFSTPMLKEQPRVDGCSLSGRCQDVLPARRPGLELLLCLGTSSGSSCSSKWYATVAVLLASSIRLTGFPKLQREVVLLHKMKMKPMTGAHAQKVKALGFYLWLSTRGKRQGNPINEDDAVYHSTKLKRLSIHSVPRWSELSQLMTMAWNLILHTLSKSILIVSHSSNPVGEIGSVYPGLWL